MFKLITRLKTKNLNCVPLLYINLNYNKYRNGEKDSCDFATHPIIKDDEKIKATMKYLCDYIRETYDMDKII